MNNQIKTAIISFIDELKVKIVNDEVTPQQLTLLSKLYLEYNFQKDNSEDADMIKYLFLGWYINNFLSLET